MYIKELRIRNFRNFKVSRFRFQRGVNTLIGENGSGKTNVMYALRLLIDESLSRNVARLRETDFCRSLAQWRGHWIIISIVFDELDASEGCQLLKHVSGHMNRSNTGACSLYFRPKKEIRSQLYEKSGCDKSELEEYLNTISIDDYEPLFTGRPNFDPLSEEAYGEVVGDFSRRVFPNPEDEDQDTIGVRLFSPVHQEVACTFVRALRDVVKELSSYRGNPLLNLLRGVEKSIEIGDANKITAKVKELNQDISSLSEIEELASGIEDILQEAVGRTYGPSVSIESSLPDSLERLLQRLNVLIGESGDSSYRGELHEQSLGGANLIYLALKLLEYERKQASDRVAYFLLVEEPEAHLHTHIQKALFSSLSSSKTQVIVSTHSTHVSSASKIGSVNVLAKHDNYAEVYFPVTGLAPDVILKIERYLDAVRSTLLFAKGVLLVEGEAELLLIPALLKAVFGMTPDELGFSIISMDSAFFEHIAVIFGEERIRRSCAVLTDLDQSLIELPEDDSKDDKQVAHARAAHVAGERRKERLNNFTKENFWLEAFYAEHTFEVDFIHAGNSYEVVLCLKDIFSQKAAKQRSKDNLESEDLTVSGLEILRLAEKCGKGWFALLVSEKLIPATYIPLYILRAVAFVCYSSVTDEILKQMAVNRIRSVQECESSTKAIEMNFEGLTEQIELPPKDFVEHYKSVMPNDDLTAFIGHVEGYRALL